MNKQLLLGIGIGVVAAVLIAGAPLRSMLFGLVFLACPLMMVFMMRGMHGNNSHESSIGRPGDKVSN